MQAPNRHLTRVVVMASGTGSNLQAILDACSAGELYAEVVAVVSDNDNAYALKRAADAGVPSVHVGRHAGEERADYDSRLADVVSGFAPDLIVLAGWMRVLTNAFLGWSTGSPTKVSTTAPFSPRSKSRSTSTTPSSRSRHAFTPPNTTCSSWRSR